jgi:hypothetical protein
MSGDPCPANSCNDRASFENLTAASSSAPPTQPEFSKSRLTVHGTSASTRHKRTMGSRLPWAPPLSKAETAPLLGSKLLNAKLRSIADPSTIGSLAAAAAFRTACANRYAQEARKVLAKTRGVKIGFTRSRHCRALWHHLLALFRFSALATPVRGRNEPRRRAARMRGLA